MLLRSLSIECLCARLKWGVFFVALCVAEYDRRVVIKGRSGARDDGLYTKKNRCKTKVLQRLSAFKDFSDAHSEGILKPFCGERGIRTPGASQLNGFQDRRNRPLCHLSNQVKETLILESFAKVIHSCKMAMLSTKKIHQENTLQTLELLGI